MERVREVCEKLDALVILEGTQSMTDCVKLAEYFLQRKTECRIVGVPSLCRTTVRNSWIEASLEFDTISRFYAHLVGNMETESPGKY